MQLMQLAQPLHQCRSLIREVKCRRAAIPSRRFAPREAALLQFVEQRDEVRALDTERCAYVRLL
jgi:hypothetical protein